MCDLKSFDPSFSYIHLIERLNFKYRCSDRFNGKKLIHLQIYQGFTKIRLPNSTDSVIASGSATNSN